MPEFDVLRLKVRKYTKELEKREEDGKVTSIYNTLANSINVPQKDINALRNEYKNILKKLDIAKSRLFSGEFDKHMEKLAEQDNEKVNKRMMEKYAKELSRGYQDYY